MSDIRNSKLNNNDLSADLVRDLIKERRRDRRWRNIRFFLGIILFGLVVLGIFSINTPTLSAGEPGAGDSYIALLRLDGMIAPGQGFSVEEVVPQLKLAFADKDAQGVILDINSGGGTPVQASIIHDEIVKLKHKYHKRVIVVGEDMLASGAYFVAVSADKIYVNPNTVTGSIGVIMEGFGFPDLIKKIGVDRRAYASGDHKDRLDPFLPAAPDDITKVHGVLDEVHANFTDVVKAGRQGKLQGDPQELFSGDFWTGQTALKLGLVDGLGDLWDVMQTEFQVSRYKDYSASGGFLKSLANQLGSFFDLPLKSERGKVLAQI
jgi:protease IV